MDSLFNSFFFQKFVKNILWVIKSPSEENTVMRPHVSKAPSLESFFS